ncbi:HET-domain-containing protein [Xylariaceae sp. FL1272]|nr:HET-domain-containing protein [Xylariaceae sp. FL1272]
MDERDPCSVCRDLTPLPGPSGGFINGGLGVELETSAPNCQYCSILWEGLSTLAEKDTRAAQWIALRQEEDAFRLQYRYGAEDKIYLGLHFYTKDARSPYSHIFKPSRDLEPDTSCAKYLEEVKYWVDDCGKNHERCMSRLSTKLPSRVLDVGLHDDFVFLRETRDGDNGPYTALSHVWGGRVPMQTTMENLSLRKDGIRLSDLPLTFREAVYMTRQLGCHFIWIDSLCIIQNDTDDWKKEATRMADIYGNAFVTLAAVKSVDSSGGLFSKHDDTKAKLVILRDSSDGSTSRIFVRPSLEHTVYYESRSYGLPPGTEARLLDRAWCYQEYILSPRILLFTDWEILWGCLTTVACNCGNFNQDTRTVILESNLKTRFNRELGSNSVKDVHRIWRDLVAAYSMKRLTFETDKLPALAGIAHRFVGKGLGRYVNGLWEETLLSDLFWETSRQFAEFYDIDFHRSRVRSIPTWSWASVDGPIDIKVMMMVEGLSLVDIEFYPHSDSLADTGAKSLFLEGRLIPSRLWMKTGSSRLLRSLKAERFEDAVVWAIDVPGEVICGVDRPMKGFILCGEQGPGLVLRLDEATGSYRRLGCIKSLPKDRRGYETRTIELR